MDLSGVDIPPGVALAAYGQDLTVTSTAPGLELSGDHLGLSLADTLGAADPALLNAAARRALQGRPSSLTVRDIKGRELAVRLEPDRAGAGATVFWFESSGSGIEAHSERARADELEQVFGATRELARSMYADEARGTICEAAAAVCNADRVLLFEPDPTADRLVATGLVGIEGTDWALPMNENSGAIMALRSNAPRMSPSERDEPAGLRRFMSASGTASAFWQPVSRGRTVRAILMVGWERELSAIDARSARLLEFVAIEAAVAIDRGTALERLVSMARTDAVTGLANRRAWEHELRREQGRVRRQGSPLALAMIDLDGFKELNDSAGHQVGDLVLASLAESWQAVLRETDVLARYGGDEFAIALPDCTQRQAEILLARLQRAVSDRIQFCAGLTEWDREESASALVARADAVLYEAKGAGPGTVVVSR